jgi:hypothetical protein
MKGSKKRVVFRHWLSSGQRYSTQLQSVITYADANAITKPSAATLSAQDTFIRNRVNDGSWSLFDRVWLPALNNTSLSGYGYLNLKAPGTDTLSPQSSPSYTVGGLQGNGSSSYFDTGFNPSTEGVNYTLNSASFGCYVRTAPVTGIRLMGTIGNLANELMYTNLATQRINSTNNLSGGVVDMQSTGYLALNRTTSTDFQLYKGTTKFDRTATSTSVVSANFAFGRSQNLYSDAVISFGFTGGSLTQTQHNNIANDLVTYLTAIGL